MRQHDLFEHVAATFLTSQSALSQSEIYAQVAERAGLDHHALRVRAHVGKSGQKHNLIKRAVRWSQQTLKHLGLIERVEGARGAWRLAQRTKTGLHEAGTSTRLVAFSTDLGLAIWGRCESVIDRLDQAITLVVTSPPYCLAKARAYGGTRDETLYIDFILKAMAPLVRRLVPGGSICLNLTNDAFLPNSPARSLYLQRLTLALHDRLSLQLMDTLLWENKSRPPGPIQYASKLRVQLNAGYEPILWFTNDPSRVRADNRRVLEPHSPRHLALMAAGGERRHTSYGDGAYALKPGSFGKPTEGRIPRNVITMGHRCKDTQQYRRDAAALNLPIHGAMQPIGLANFLIRFLSEPGDLIVDPFGGTAKTGRAAETLGRRWLVVESMLDYLRGGAERFRDAAGFQLHTAL